MEYFIRLPLTRRDAEKLCAGDTVYITGVLYTARDAAHKRLIELLDEGGELPLPLEDATIYYTGPAPAPPGGIIGSAGPTTSYRMDAYTPALLKRGLRGMIGKGRRSQAVVEAMQEATAVYFGAIGGAGALLAGCVKACQVVAFPDLGTEAIHRLEVENLPVVVVIDTYGSDLYDTGRKAYLESKGQRRS